MDCPDFLNKKLPLFSVRAWGKWKKDKIFQVINGKQFIREYTVYDGSIKNHLKPFYSKFAAAVWNWQKLNISQRRPFNARATKLGLQISGYNYFISLYMRDKLEDFMGYPDPHHKSHEKGGLDELDLTGLGVVGLLVYRIAEGENVIIEDTEQYFLSESCFIDGSGTISINGSGLVGIY